MAPAIATLFSKVCIFVHSEQTIWKLDLMTLLFQFQCELLCFTNNSLMPKLEIALIEIADWNYNKKKLSRRLSISTTWPCQSDQPLRWFTQLHQWKSSIFIPIRIKWWSPLSHQRPPGLQHRPDYLPYPHQPQVSFCCCLDLFKPRYGILAKAEVQK